jgi:hypothetical protein
MLHLSMFFFLFWAQNIAQYHVSFVSACIRLICIHQAPPVATPQFQEPLPMFVGFEDASGSFDSGNPTPSTELVQVRKKEHHFVYFLWGCTHPYCWPISLAFLWILWIVNTFFFKNISNPTPNKWPPTFLGRIYLDGTCDVKQRKTKEGFTY